MKSEWSEGNIRWEMLIPFLGLGKEEDLVKRKITRALG